MHARMCICMPAQSVHGSGCMYMCACMHVSVYVYDAMNICNVCMHACVCVYVYVIMNICNVYMHACVCICICVCVYIYIYI